MGQSVLSSVAGSLKTSSYCPLLETTQQLVVNPVDYTLIIIRLFNPTLLTFHVRLTETNDWSPAELSCGVMKAWVKLVTPVCALK